MPHVTAHRFSRTCAFAFGFVATVQAQENADLRYLLFEPVPIPAQASLAADAVPLPTTDAPVELRTWLAQRAVNSKEDGVQTDRDIARYRQLITTFENQQGAFSPSLSQELLGLAALLTHAGQEDEALQLYERVLHIIRINHGLYSAEQQEVVEQIISTHLTRGDMLAAHQQQEYLFHLQRRSAPKDRLDSQLEPLEHQAAWNLFTFSAFSTPNPVYQNVSAPNLGDTFVDSSQELAIFRAQGLLRAQTLYEEMIRLIKEQHGANHAKLPPLLLDLAVTCFHFLSNFNANSDVAAYQQLWPYEMGTPSVNSLCSRAGRAALEERAQVLDTLQASATDRLRARLYLVDWLLYFNRRVEAANMLQALRTEWSNNGPAVAALLNPPMPVPVPGFLPPNYSRQLYNVPQDLKVKYAGFVDVAFTINALGAVRSLDVLRVSEGTPQGVEERLTRHIRRTVFRPRFAAAANSEGDSVQLRYHYAY